MNGFWIHGSTAHEEALQQEYQCRFEALQERRKQAETIEEKRQISRELRDLKAELRARLAGIRRALF